MKKISGSSSFEAWFSMFILIIFNIFFILTCVFNSDTFQVAFLFFQLFICYFYYMLIVFYEIYLYPDKIQINNYVSFKKHSFKKEEFLFFERQNFGISVYRINFRNGEKFIFHIFASRNSAISPFGFTKKKDTNMVYWEKCISEMID
jgi:hypothetical protein